MTRTGGGAPWLVVLGGVLVVALAVAAWLVLQGAASRRVHLAMNLPPARTLPLRRGPQPAPLPIPRPPS